MPDSGLDKGVRCPVSMSMVTQPFTPTSQASGSQAGSLDAWPEVGGIGPVSNCSVKKKLEKEISENNDAHRNGVGYMT